MSARCIVPTGRGRQKCGRKVEAEIHFRTRARGGEYVRARHGTCRWHAGVLAQALRNAGERDVGIEWCGGAQPDLTAPEPRRSDRGYRRAVEWIACNDGAGDPERLDPAHVGGMVTVCLVADLFGKRDAVVGEDVVRLRRREDAERAKCAIQKSPDSGRMQA